MLRLVHSIPGYQQPTESVRGRPRSAAEITAYNALVSRVRAAERPQKRAALVRYHTAKRRALLLQRTPPWADMEAIRRVYEEAQRRSAVTGVPFHVDHEIPLQGELVSGLHVHNNLQVLTGSENSKKRNRFDIEP